MGFCIYYQRQAYTANDFIKISSELAWVNQVKLVIACWIHEKPFVFYSSGSTRDPKAFSFEKWQLEISAQATIAALNLNSNEHFLLCLNAKFVGGAMMLVRAIILDCPITIMEPQWGIFSAIEEDHSYTFASFVPMQLLHSSFSKNKYQKIKNILIGGTTIPESLVQVLLGQNNKTYHTYGMTETLSHVALKEINKDLGFRAILPHQIRINNDLCICISSPILEKELVTHDMALALNNGEFKLLGRTDFIINSGGIKVNPEAIEALISYMIPLPIKKQFAISSISHPVLGEQVILVLEEEFDEMGFQDIVLKLQNLGFKNDVPRKFRVINSIPLTENGKIDRKKLNEYINNQ